MLIMWQVADVSVASCGQLWTVLTSLAPGAETAGAPPADPAAGAGSPTAGSGLLARRAGVTKSSPLGTSWELAAGTGWSMVDAKMIMPQD